MKLTSLAYLARMGAIGLACALLNSSPATADIDLVFGTYATDKPTVVVRQFRPFLDHLEDELTKSLSENVSIRMKIAKEYEGGIAQLVEGDVDFTRFGPASYITAKDLNPEISIIAMELKKGKKRFNGVIAVHADSEFTALSQLTGHSFAFGDPLSTIGRYLSQSHLIEAGITSDDLKSFEFLGRHDLVGTSVGSGKFTAGALKESTFQKLVDSGEPIRALHTFDNVTKPWLARADLDARIVEALRKIMLEIGDPTVLESIAKDGFTKGSDADYDFVRQAMKNSQGF